MDALRSLLVTLHCFVCVCVVCVSKVTGNVEHLNVKTLRVHLDRVVQDKSVPIVKYSTMKTCGRMEA